MFNVVAMMQKAELGTDPKVIKCGQCNRNYGEHTRDCLTAFMDGRDPNCGCDDCHSVLAFDKELRMSP